MSRILGFPALELLFLYAALESGTDRLTGCANDLGVVSVISAKLRVLRQEKSEVSLGGPVLLCGDCHADSECRGSLPVHVLLLWRVSCSHSTCASATDDCKVSWEKSRGSGELVRIDRGGQNVDEKSDAKGDETSSLLMLLVTS